MLPREASEPCTRYRLPGGNSGLHRKRQTSMSHMMPKQHKSIRGSSAQAKNFRIDGSSVDSFDVEDARPSKRCVPVSVLCADALRKYFEQQARIAYASSDRSDHLAIEHQSRKAVPAPNTSDRRLQPDQVGVRGGPSNRSAAVGRKCKRR